MAIKVLTSVVLGAAMLAGTYGIVKTNVVPTAENKVSSMFEVTDAVELNGGGAGGGVVVPDPVVELKRNGIIPEGGTYYPGAERCDGCGNYYNNIGLTCPDCGYTFTKTSVSLPIGDNFPATPANGDLYVEGDYNYSYYSQRWSVSVIDKSKTEYGEIISEIAGKPVTSLYFTFQYCTALTTAPTIPSSITDMTCTFDGCTSLTTAPVIPNGVTKMASTFSGCTSLTTAPAIPNSVTNMNGTFDNCSSLTTAPSIPNSVTDMSDTFSRCTSLTTPPDMSNASSVTNMYETFMSCTSLTSAPVIPNGVENLNSTFMGCSALTTVSVIPSSVTDMTGTFWSCHSLTGTIEINANPECYDDCFCDTTKSIVLTGASTMLNDLASTGYNGNVTVA